MCKDEGKVSMTTGMSVKLGTSRLYRAMPRNEGAKGDRRPEWGAEGGIAREIRR